MNASPPGSSSGDAWRIQLLGSFRVERNGQTASFRTKKTASLLAYLAYYAGRRISKELLVEALWPESDSEKGRHSLRVAISSLRSTFEGPGWDPAQHIWSDRDTIEVTEAGFSTDVREFSDLIAAADSATDPRLKADHLRKAVALYAGPFLPGFGDPWILPQALELEEAFAQAACDLIGLLAAAGDVPGAVTLGRRALGLCATREDLHVALMRAYASAGQSSQVMKQYEELEKMLDDTWGEMPGDEAMSILESLPRRTGPTIRDSVAVAAPSQMDFQPARSSFFGRDRELRELQEMLQPEAQSPRLVTLFGLGGTGKTRLAMRCSQDLMPAYGGRSWFASLVGLEEAAQLHDALVSAIGLPPVVGSDILGALGSLIGPEFALLVMDNVEQIVPATRQSVRQLLEACPGLKILATSRVPLDADGERLVPVVPLQLPGDYRDLNALRQTPSVQLLVEAAQAVRPGFAVTPANAQSILLLSQRLEGIPLAIELAAAKLGMLTPAQVIASIGRRVDLSTSRTEVREQHRSLRTIVEWSLGLLTEAERTAFAMLGVCRGGFNIELARALLGSSADEFVQRLCRCSLVSWTESSDEVRFDMLETVREMALQLLEADAELKRKAVAAHFRYVRDLCRSDAKESDTYTWVQQMAADTGNILVALEAGTQGDVDPALAWEVALPLEDFLDRRGRTQIWVAPIEALLKATIDDLDPVGAAKAHAFMAYCYYALRDIRATWGQYCLSTAAADQTDDRRLRIWSRTDSVSAAITLGAFDDAQRVLEEAIDLLAEVDDAKSAASCYLNLAWVVFDRGNEESSEPIFAESVALAERSGEKAMLASALIGHACGIGHVRYEESQPVFDLAQKLWKETELPSRIAHSYYYRGLIDYRHGQLERALENVKTSFEMYVENGTALGQSSLTICGNLMAALGRNEDAAMCWGRADAARKKHGMLMIPCLERDYSQEVVKVKAQMTGSAFEAARGRALDITDAAYFELLFPEA